MAETAAAAVAPDAAQGTIPEVPPSTYLAKGLYDVLEPVVLECDARVQAVFASQGALAQQLDVLAAELKRLTESTQMPPLTPYVKKLNTTRQRINKIHAMLRVIQDRLDKMYSSVPEELRSAHAGMPPPDADTAPDATSDADAAAGEGQGQGEGQAEGEGQGEGDGDGGDGGDADADADAEGE